MDSREIISIFKQFGFKISNDSVIGQIIEMDPEDAFLFSSTTGAKYLLSENGTTMKGRSEVFIHRSVFSDNYLIYTPGLFSRTIDGYLAEGNSARKLKDRYPSILQSSKRIIIHDLDGKRPSNIENEIYRQIEKAGGNPANYVLYKNNTSSYLGESIQEYFASLYFIRKGFLVENQVPWFQQNYKYNGKTYQGGIPDFSAFHGSISNYLYKYNFINDSAGVSLLLLPVISLFRTTIFESNPENKKYDWELLIGEAKTSSTSLPQALRQLDKYDAVDLSKELFTIIPNSSRNDKYGSFYILNSHIIYSSMAQKEIKNSRALTDDQWISTYVKMLLLGNIQFENVIAFVKDFRKKHNLSYVENIESDHLLDAVQNTTDEDYFIFLKRSW